MPWADEPLRVAPIDEHVDERRALIVEALHAVGARRGALDADGGVRVDEALHVVGDARRDRPTRVDHLAIDGNLGHGAILARSRVKASLPGTLTALRPSAGSPPSAW